MPRKWQHSREEAEKVIGGGGMIESEMKGHVPAALLRNTGELMGRRLLAQRRRPLSLFSVFWEPLGLNRYNKKVTASGG